MKSPMKKKQKIKITKQKKTQPNKTTKWT